MIPLFAPDMIRISRIEDNLLAILLHTALEPDFLRMARRKHWTITPVNAPEEYVGYTVTGAHACDEIEARVSRSNPWFAFDDADKWEGANKWR